MAQSPPPALHYIPMVTLWGQSRFPTSAPLWLTVMKNNCPSMMVAGWARQRQSDRINVSGSVLITLPDTQHTGTALSRYSGTIWKWDSLEQGYLGSRGSKIENRGWMGLSGMKIWWGMILDDKNITNVKKYYILYVYMCITIIKQDVDTASSDLENFGCIILYQIVLEAESVCVWDRETDLMTSGN